MITVRGAGYKRDFIGISGWFWYCLLAIAGRIGSWVINGVARRGIKREVVG